MSPPQTGLLTAPSIPSLSISLPHSYDYLKIMYVFGNSLPLSLEFKLHEGRDSMAHSGISTS